MDEKKTACEVFSALETTSEWKASFICANDDLHRALVESPLAIFAYAFGVLLVMFLVQHASRPNPNALKKRSRQRSQNKDIKPEDFSKKEDNSAS
jgi:hypothetical protein